MASYPPNLRGIRKPQEGRGPWLIWSVHWARWHRRNSEGGASGYTDDIAQAGIFPLSKAQAYHYPGGRDRAIPVVRAMKDIERRLAELTAERDAFAAKVEEVRAALQAQATSD